MLPPAPIFWKKVDENQVSYCIWPYIHTYYRYVHVSRAFKFVMLCLHFHSQVNITLLSEQLNFVSDSVMVIMEWNQRDFSSYNISVTPQLALEYTVDNLRVQLNVPFNTFYNVSIIASPPCGQNSYNFVELHYCEHHN